MAGRFSIARKIFGLAMVLLFLTAALACFLLWQVMQLHEELRIVAVRDVPLANSLAKINEDGLRRRMAFERWFGELNSDLPNAEIVSEASTNYDLFTKQLGAEFSTARKLLELNFEGEDHQKKFGEIRALLSQIESTYPLSNSYQREVLDMQLAGQHERAHDILRVMNDVQRALQHQREQMRDEMAVVTQEVVQHATSREQRIIWLTVAATVSVVVLGLTLAAMVTQRLVTPVRSLVKGLQNVEKGDLSVELPVITKDEIGILTQSFNFFVRELQSKEKIKQIFGKYIDPRVIEQAILQPGSAAIAGGRQVMTVSFADIVGFTGMNEQLTPSGMVNLLNYHFTLQAEIVQQQKGIVDKFIGDSVMAFWGPPFTEPDAHAFLACQAALSQVRAMETFRAQLPELTGLRKNLPQVDLRIGISTGEVIAGNIGSENTRSYTVIGDAVNLGQRLEQANRVYDTKILITEATWKSVAADIISREIDVLLVKGKTEPIRIFELMDLQNDTTENNIQLCERFALALAAYRRLEWDSAEAFLRECLIISPDDGPSKVFLNRIEQLRRQPPDEHWDGTWRLDSK